MLQLQPAKCCKVILTCAVLHNIAMRNNLPDPEIEEADEEEDVAAHDYVDARGGVRTRQNLIDHHFTR